MSDLTELDDFGALVIRAGGRVFGARPGGHDSRGDGAGGPFTALTSLLDHVDPRRIDVRASLADPLGTIWVRRFRRTTAARVVVLLDASASMTAAGRVDRRAVARHLVAGLAHAVSRSPDSFGLLLGGGAGVEAVVEAAIWPPTRRRGLADEVAAILTHARFAGSGLGGLLAAAEMLPRRRAIVPLVSDFAAPLDEVDSLLDRLSDHDVRPIVLRDTAIDAPTPGFGLVHLDDLEGGGRRIALMRPTLARRWREETAAHRRALDALFAEHGLHPIHIVDQIDVTALFDAFTGAFAKGGQ